MVVFMKSIKERDSHMPASSTGKRKTQSRSSATGKKKPPAKRMTAAQKRAKMEQERRARQQIGAIILFALGLLFICLSFIEGQNVWNWIHNGMFGLFGWCAWLIGPICIVIAIVVTMDKKDMLLSHKVWQAGVLLLLICAATQVFGDNVVQGESLWDKLGFLFEQGKTLSGGGLVSALFALPLTSLLGSVGAGVVIVLLIFVFLMVLTGFTLFDLFKTAAKPVKKMEQAYIEKAQEKEERAAQASFNIDVPLDKESKYMPAHPVEAPKGTGAAAMTVEEEQAWAEAELLKRQAQESGRKRRENEKAREEAAKKPMEMVEELPPIKAPDPMELLDAPEERQPESQEPSIPPFEVEDTPVEVKKEGAKDDGFQFDLGGTVTEAVAPVHPKPPITLLKEPGPARVGDENEQQNGEILIETLKSFGVRASIIDIARGPAVTRYELQPAPGVKISKITNLADDIALNLAAAGVRIEAPIPGKPAVGIEVPNKHVGIVGIREIIDSPEFENSKSKLTVALGKDVSGNIAVADIGKMPHMLIAGATGSGKSVCINSIIISLLYKATPDEVKLLMVDPKVVELGVYNGIPNLLVPVVTDPRKAAGALNWAVNEMLNRYKLFADNGVRDLKGFNKLANSKEEEDFKPLPEIVIIIDELADLMMAAPNEVEDAICRLAQMARAAGMHLVIATQRPSVDVITGVIKANIPSRIAFAVSSQVDSRTILDMGGAEKLLGRGDMLFYPVGMSKPLRVQGCYVSDSEVERVVAFVKEAQDADYDENVMEEIEKQAVAEKNSGGDGGGFSEEDEMLPKAIECVIEAGQASTSLLQRRLKLGYARAARLIDEMEQRGVVGPFEGSKPRQVLMTRQQWIEMNLQRDE